MLDLFKTISFIQNIRKNRSLKIDVFDLYMSLNLNMFKGKKKKNYECYTCWSRGESEATNI